MKTPLAHWLKNGNSEHFFSVNLIVSRLGPYIAFNITSSTVVMPLLIPTSSVFDFLFHAFHFVSFKLGFQPFTPLTLLVVP